MILEEIISADNNPNYSTNPGNDTKDRVFLLSIVEAEKYFSSDDARKCIATDYATARGVACNSYNYTLWWLRSPGYQFNYAAYVDSKGSVDFHGHRADYYNFAVRPALWIVHEP